MATRRDRVFLIRDDEISAIPSRSMRDGLLGKSLEDALQSIFENYPEILPGHQIAAGADDPPRFVLLRREMPVGSSWSLDHLYVDQYGIPTLVETKLSQNPESRREVIGQIVEYAASADSTWTSTLIRERSSRYWQDRGETLENVLEREFGPDLDIEAFWSLVDTALRQHNLRLIIAADELRPEVRRMIEYLNKEMRNAQVLGLELECYAEDDHSVILSPHLIGQSSQILEQKNSNRNNTIWNERKLKEAFSEIQPHQRAERLIKVLEWAVENNVTVFSPAANPAFGVLGKAGLRIVSLYGTGEIYALFELRRYGSFVDDRQMLMDVLQEMGMLDRDMEVDEIRSGKTCLRRIDDLNDNEFDRLIGLFTELSGT